MRPVKTLAREVEARVEALLLREAALEAALREANEIIGPFNEPLCKRIDALLGGRKP